MAFFFYMKKSDLLRYQYISYIVLGRYFYGGLCLFRRLLQKR